MAFYADDGLLLPCIARLHTGGGCMEIYTKDAVLAVAAELSSGSTKACAELCPRSGILHANAGRATVDDFDVFEWAAYAKKKARIASLVFVRSWEG